MESSVRKRIIWLIGAALFAGAAFTFVPQAFAGSCCGGGSAVSLIVPGYAHAVMDLSFDAEIYDGFWNQDGKYTSDPPGSDLRQYRLNVGYAQRFFRRWQASIMVPYVWNSNRYSGISSSTNGLGDTTLNLWYEVLNDTTAWRVRSLSDMVPSVTIGPSLLIPTGISPYDDVDSSFDVTGRGFYRLDGNLLIEKTLQPWNVSLFFSYGTYFERSVNREYGKYVEPYRKDLGDRLSTSLCVSYNYYLGSGGDTLTGSASLSYLQEEAGSIDGSTDRSSAFKKTATGLSLSYSSTDRDWSVRGSWSHAIKKDDWGENFPTTDIYTLGVRYVFR